MHSEFGPSEPPGLGVSRRCTAQKGGQFQAASGAPKSCLSNRMQMGVSSWSWGSPQVRWMGFCEGKSQSKMDDDWGYPYFRKALNGCVDFGPRNTIAESLDGCDFPCYPGRLTVDATSGFQVWPRLTAFHAWALTSEHERLPPTESGDWNRLNHNLNLILIPCSSQARSDAFSIGFFRCLGKDTKRCGKPHQFLRKMILKQWVVTHHSFTGEPTSRIYSGWWFGTFFIFPYIGNNHPNWLIFFRGVQTTNQILIDEGRFSEP